MAKASKKVLITPSASRQARGAKRKKVLIALSGGIDSAVSAYLLIKQGYEVEAAFMKNWSSTAGLKVNECPWLVDRQDALRVAAFLRIPLHTLDFEKQYEKNVLDYFFKEYAAGRTPNPDVMCNKEIKFKLLYNWAIKNGFDYLATGHYAKVVKSHQVIKSSSSPRPDDFALEDFRLIRSADEFKDQTYFIYNIKTEQLPHVLFPIGGMKKADVRLLARKIKLPNAEKKESMGLCFVGRIRLKDFLEQKLKARAGKIVLADSVSLRVQPKQSFQEKGIAASSRQGMQRSGLLAMTHGDTVGQTIGQHQGLHNYTIGQRQGIKVGGGGPFYVVKKDLKKNILYVTNNPNDERLETKEIEIHSVNWISQLISQSANKPVSLLGRYRHQGDLIPLVAYKMSNNHYHVTFQKPQKAVASGQSLVLYNGKECVGGGVIA